MGSIEPTTGSDSDTLLATMVGRLSVLESATLVQLQVRSRSVPGRDVGGLADFHTLTVMTSISCRSYHVFAPEYDSVLELPHVHEVRASKSSVSDDRGGCVQILLP
jgi:hypothetical protein